MHSSGTRHRSTASTGPASSTPRRARPTRRPLRCSRHARSHPRTCATSSARSAKRSTSDRRRSRSASVAGRTERNAPPWVVSIRWSAGTSVRRLRSGVWSELGRDAMRCRALAVVAIGALIAAGCTTLVEVSAPNGANHAGYSFPYFDGGGPLLSGDARYSVFTAPRTATSPTPEAFRRDGKSGKTVRVSSDASGAAVGGDAPVISRDGRYVAFRTTASLASEDHNLDPSRGLTGYDWYVKDM